MTTINIQISIKISDEHLVVRINSSVYLVNQVYLFSSTYSRREQYNLKLGCKCLCCIQAQISPSITIEETETMVPVEAMSGTRSVTWTYANIAALLFSARSSHLSHSRCSPSIISLIKDRQSFSARILVGSAKTQHAAGHIQTNRKFLFATRYLSVAAAVSPLRVEVEFKTLRLL
uniref:Uncharacterized protein n=1 Tax=Coccidioides posadasii RMSCC 3488 TaxID=454284 RepID=A0A0J6EWK2_COCPO|nr:hypothetical protein CPAG_01293 [Coccidioides posadasii RMSCC 3488]